MNAVFQYLNEGIHGNVCSRFKTVDFIHINRNKNSCAAYKKT